MFSCTSMVQSHINSFICGERNGKAFWEIHTWKMNRNIHQRAEGYLKNPQRTFNCGKASNAFHILIHHFTRSEKIKWIFAILNNKCVLEV